MNFSSPSRVQATLRAGDAAEFARGQNRAKILRAANGAPPLDPATAKKLGIHINIEWGELMLTLAQARRQYRTAFWSNMNFFRVTIPKAPAEHQSEWGEFITNAINRPMRRSRKYFELHESRWAAVVCHGLGPMVWYEPDK